MAEVQIKIAANGPFLVTGAITLCDHQGGQFDLSGKETIALCRCGVSKNRPFCDGSHKACEFTSGELAPSA